MGCCPFLHTICFHKFCVPAFHLTLKAPIMTAVDDKFYDIFFLNFEKKSMIFHENRLPADDSHEIL